MGGHGFSQKPGSKSTDNKLVAINLTYNCPVSTNIRATEWPRGAVHYLCSEILGDMSVIRGLIVAGGSRGDWETRGTIGQGTNGNFSMKP